MLEYSDFRRTSPPYHSLKRIRWYLLIYFDLGSGQRLERWKKLLPRLHKDRS